MSTSVPMQPTLICYIKGAALKVRAKGGRDMMGEEQPFPLQQDFTEHLGWNTLGPFLFWPNGLSTASKRELMIELDRIWVIHNQVIPSTQGSIFSRQKIAILLIILIHLLLSACCFWQYSTEHGLSFQIHGLCFLGKRAEYLEIKLHKLAYGAVLCTVSYSYIACISSFHDYFYLG